MAAAASASASATAPKEHAPTAEQRAFIESTFPRDAVVLIDAVAGSGKTTTLVKFMQHNRHLRILYLVYNKEAQLAAERVLRERNCTNTKPQTLHSLAYEVVRARRAAEGKPPIGAIDYPNKALLVDYVLAHATTSAQTAAYLRAKGGDTAFFEVYKQYLKDTQMIIDEPYVRASLAPLTTQISKRSDAVPAVLQAMRTAWAATSGGEVPASQDALAKLLFKMSTEIHHSYDIVLCDEAQDVSTQFAEVIMRWRGTVPIVFVGDRCQHIYSFLGTSNIFTSERTAPTHRFALSRSFRFGDAVAALARSITQRPIVGHDGLATRVVVEDVRGLIPLKHVAMQPGTTAYLHRTNVGLLLHAAEIAALRPPRRIKLIGNSANVLNDVDALVKDMRDQPGMIQVKRKTALNAGNEGRVKLIDWVQSNAASASGLVRQLRDRIVTSGHVDALLGTVHAAKGLEWEFVVLSDDLIPEATREYQIIKMAAGGGRGSTYGKRKFAAISAVDAATANVNSAAGAAAIAAVDAIDAADDGETTDTEDEQPHSLPRTRHTSIDEDEHWRLLYVAETRPRKLLIVSRMLDRVIRKRDRYFARLRAEAAAAAEPAAAAAAPSE